MFYNAVAYVQNAVTAAKAAEVTMVKQFNAAPQDWLPMCGVKIHMFPFKDKVKAHALAHWAEKKTKNSKRPVTASVSLCNVDPAFNPFNGLKEHNLCSSGKPCLVMPKWQVVLRNW